MKTDRYICPVCGKDDFEYECNMIEGGTECKIPCFCEGCEAELMFRYVLVEVEVLE